LKFVVIITLICLSLITVLPSYASHGDNDHCINDRDCPPEVYLLLGIFAFVIIIIMVVIIKRKNKDTSSQSPFQRKDDDTEEELGRKYDSEKKRIDDEWKEKFDKQFSSNKKMSADELEKNKLNKYYKLLELEQSATPIQIKNQYRKLIKFYHPDNFQNTPEKLEHSEQKTKELTYAYENLKNAGKLN
jgi:uncharacterized membrane protein